MHRLHFGWNFNMIIKELFKVVELGQHPKEMVTVMEKIVIFLMMKLLIYIKNVK
jgi:hypothetical protein